MNELVGVDGDYRQFCSFRTGGRLYGIDVAQVREVSAQVAFTPVPHAPPAVRGLANLRSRVYLVVDARPIMGFPPAVCTADSRLIILKPHLAEQIGVLVEHGGDIVRVASTRIEESPPADSGAEAAAHRATDVVVGVCKLETELMNIIDSARLIASVETMLA